MSLRQTITRWLRRQKEIRKEGMIDILDSTGVPTGVTAHIYEIHDRGHWHATVNVYVVNSKNEVLLQKRSPQVRVFPNMWTLSAGGHVRSGQSIVDAAKEEVLSEIGLSLTDADLIPIRSTVKQDVHLDGTNFDNEFQSNFVVFQDVSIESLRAGLDEVSNIAWMPIQQYREIVSRKDPAYVLHASIPAFFEYVDSQK